MQGPAEVPWTITSLTTHPGRKTYVDIGKSIPSDDQFAQASEHPTGHVRYTSKKRGPEQGTASGDPHRARHDGSQAMQTSHAAFETEVELPTSRRGIKRVMGSPEAFVVSQLRKNTVEVRERNLTDDELLQFRNAKNKEVKSYIQSHCFKVLPEAIQQSQDAVGMRWVLSLLGNVQQKTRL